MSRDAELIKLANGTGSVQHPPTIQLSRHTGTVSTPVLVRSGSIVPMMPILTLRGCGYNAPVNVFGGATMTYTFSTTVSRGEAKDEAMEPWKDEDDNFVLFNPTKRRGGSVHADDCFRTRSPDIAKKMIEERGFSMRMKIRGTRSGPASVIKAGRIVVIDLADESKVHG